MRKEWIIVILIVLFVAIGEVITQGYTKDCTNRINMQLSELRELAQKEDNEEMVKKMNNIKDEWREMQEKLAFYIEHTELEKIETQLHLIKGEIDAQLYNDMIPEMEKCIFILEHVEEKNLLNAKNIF